MDDRSGPVHIKTVLPELMADIRRRMARRRKAAAPLSPWYSPTASDEVNMAPARPGHDKDSGFEDGRSKPNMNARVK